MKVNETEATLTKLQVQKLKPVSKCLKPAAMTSRGRLLRL